MSSKYFKYLKEIWLELKWKLDILFEDYQTSCKLEQTVYPLIKLKWWYVIVVLLCINKRCWQMLDDSKTPSFYTLREIKCGMVVDYLCVRLCALCKHNRSKNIRSLDT